MAYLSVDALADYLESLETEGVFSCPLNDQIHGLKLELRFLSTVLRCTSLGLIKDGDEDLLDLLTRIDSFVEEAEMKLAVITVEDLSDKVPCMLVAIQLVRPKIIEVLGMATGCPFQGERGYGVKYPPPSDALELIDCLLGNLNCIVNGKANAFLALKKQIEALQVSIRFMGSVVQFTANRCIGEYDILENLLVHFGAILQSAACLSYWCWVDELVDEEMIGSACVMLSNLLLKIKPTTNREAREIYWAVLKLSKSPPLNVAMKEEIVVAFIDSLLENLMELQDSEHQARLTVPSEVEIQTTLQELIFLKALINDLPNQNIEPQELDNLLVNIETVVCKAGSLVYMICAIVQQEDVAQEMNLAHLDFVDKIGLIKAEMTRIYLGKSHINSPGTCDMLFINPILSNLKDLLNYHSESIDTAKQQVETLLGGLASLSSFFEKHGGLEDCCLHFIDAAYQADYVVNSFVSRGGPVWHHLLCTVLEEINLMKTDLLETHSKDFITRGIKDSKTSIYQPDEISLAPSYLAGSSVDFNDGVVALDDEAKSSPYSSNMIDVNNVMVGRDDEANTIVDHLTKGSTELEIVSIVGMPGVGKTTLARKVYSNPSVTLYFHCCAWCCISQVYQTRELLLSILAGITDLSSHIREMSEDDLHRLLYSCLKGRRFLIVMDDIWDLEAWNNIKVSFPDDKNGSRILFTSRFAGIASKANASSSIHYVRLLSDNESLSLLEHKLFHGEVFPANLLEIGMQIAKSCQGLPLAVVAIAGLLSKTGHELDRWIEVAERLNSRYSGGYDKVMNILELSYRHLPYYLKLAFLYSGAIMQDNVIPVQKLKWLWMAEGFIQKTQELKSLEDIAEDYLMELIARNLVMVAKRKANGRVKECGIHDLLLDFCITKAKEVNCLEVIQGHDELASFLASNRQRRLCIFSGRQHFTEWKLSSPYLGSLLFFSTDNLHLTKPFDVSFVCYKFKLLRVLDLGCINIGNSFPIGIELLLHLRYLAIRGQFKFVPSLIGNLRSLETFILKGLRGEIVLPGTIWNLERLRHLHVSPRVAFNLQEYTSGIYHLAHLDTFSTPALSYGKDMENIMRKLPNIQKLRCIFLESWDCYRKSNRFPIIDFLSQLESLKASYHGEWRYPCELHLPLNLRELTLSKFRLPWHEISAIGRLPNLEVLKLLTKSFDGQRWDMTEGEFPNLKFLKLAELNIVEWNASEYSFPTLQHLVLEKCKQLKEIPVTLGEISTLEIIEVKYCSISTIISAEEIQREQEDMGNDCLKVLIYPPM